MIKQLFKSFVRDIVRDVVRDEIVTGKNQNVSVEGAVAPKKKAKQYASEQHRLNASANAEKVAMMEEVLAGNNANLVGFVPVNKDGKTAMQKLNSRQEALDIIQKAKDGEVVLG